MFFLNLTLSLFVSLVISFNAFSSDHIDGAATVKDGQADLTDLYAFKSSGGEALTVILNMYPGVGEEGHFSSKVSYGLFVRLAEENKSPLKKGFKTYVMDELNLNCKFTDPGHHHGGSSKGKIRCTLQKENKYIDGVSGDVGEELQGSYFRLFSGPRADAFFISAEKFMGVTGRKEFISVTPNSGMNAMNTINVLTITVELDVKALGLDGEMLALAAQSYTERSGVFEALDRVGRPEVTNLGLHDHSKDEPLKRMYNKMHPFENSLRQLAVFGDRLVDNITAYDALDEKSDLSSDQVKELSNLLLEDYLVIDLGANCENGNSYLSIEKDMLFNTGRRGCGGRQLTDDIMSTLYGLYIGGPYADLSYYESGVTAPYQNNLSKTLNQNFPYLAPSGQTSWTRWLLFKAAQALQE